MVYDEEVEVSVFWIVKELGTPAVGEVSKRYREISSTKTVQTFL